LLLGTQSDVVAVAATAVQHGPDGLFVYQVGPNNTISVQPIKVERQEGDVYVVSSGLSDGVVVVATGQSRLQAGVRVSTRPEAQATPVTTIKSGS
jgi:multidrug efflux system membrane fusion protein